MNFRYAIAIAILAASSIANADWTLDPRASEVTFVSTKAVDIAEVHRFRVIAGEVGDNGKAVVSINLASVDTGVEIRDERMQTMLFETDKYPEATVRTRIDKAVLKNMMPGATKRQSLELEVDLHGTKLTLPAEVAISMLSETALSVVSTKPVVVDAAAFGLGEGIEALRQAANLPSIGNGVPVSFVLLFEK